MSHSASSDLGLHCLQMYHKKDTRIIWINSYEKIVTLHWKISEF